MDEELLAHIRSLCRLMRGAGLSELDTTWGDTRIRLCTERGASRAVYYSILATVLVGFFNALNRQAVSGSIQALVDQIMAFVPKLVGAGVLGGVTGPGVLGPRPPPQPVLRGLRRSSRFGCRRMLFV